MSDETISPEQLHVVCYYGGHPLWLYLKEVLNVDIVEVFDKVTKEEPILKTANGSLVVRMVDLPHELEVGSTHDNDIVFLTSSINVVFEMLKGGLEKDGVPVLKDIKFSNDSNLNIYLINAETEERISDKALAVVKLG